MVDSLATGITQRLPHGNSLCEPGESSAPLHGRVWNCVLIRWCGVYRNKRPKRPPEEEGETDDKDTVDGMTDDAGTSSLSSESDGRSSDKPNSSQKGSNSDDEEPDCNNEEPGSDNVLTQTPQVNFKPVKRPQVNGPHSSDLAVVLNDRTKHPEFWDLDGTVILQVDNVLFRVMRSTLTKASPWFQRLFSKEFDRLETMAGCPLYTIEEEFSHRDFANLLRGLENGM
jgi:hypothetical protein